MTISGDNTLLVTGSSSYTVHNSHNETYKDDRTISISGNLVETISGTKTLTISGDTNETYKKNRIITVQKSY